MILLLWMFLYRLPVPISVWPGRIQGHGCFPNDDIAWYSYWIPLQVMYKDQLHLEHWRRCLPRPIILASSHSSLGMQILLYSSHTLEDSNLNWMFCLFRRYNVSFLSLSVWFCGYWDLTKRDHERDLTRPHPKWFRIYLITSIWMIQVVYCLWMTYLDV